jgi:hypothetical protein
VEWVEFRLLLLFGFKAPEAEKLWAMEKWKSNRRIPTFPQPRQPAAQGSNFISERAQSEPERTIRTAAARSPVQYHLALE